MNGPKFKIGDKVMPLLDNLPIRKPCMVTKINDMGGLLEKMGQQYEVTLLPQYQSGNWSPIYHIYEKHLKLIENGLQKLRKINSGK